MNDDDIPPLPDRAEGEIYSKDKQKNVALPTTADAERYSQRSVPVERSSVIQQQAAPLSRSLLHASSASLATPGEAQRVDAPPTALRRYDRRRPVMRYLLISLAVLALTVFAALFSFHQFSNQAKPRMVSTIATKQSANEHATGTVVAATAISYLATQTAVTNLPHHDAVPGPCNNNSNWSAEYANIPPADIQCLPDSLRLTYTYGNYAIGQTIPPPPGIVFLAQAVYGNFTKFSHISIAMTAFELTPSSCLWLIANGLTTSFQICQDGTWSIISTSKGKTSTGIHHFGNAAAFTLQVTADTTSEQYSIDETVLKSVSHISNQDYVGANGVTYMLFSQNSQVPSSGAVNLKDFSYTPLP